MLRALALAVGDLADPRILSVLMRSLLITLLIFAGVGLLLAWALEGADPCALLMDEGCPLGLSASGLGAFMLTALALWFLFPAVAIGVITGFIDRIVAAVEQRHYPAAAATARPLGLAGSAWLGLRSSLRILLYNLVALPLYVLLLVTGVGALILFLLVNGVAVGRDLGEMVASRHGAPPERRAWLAASRGDRAMLGIVVSAIFLVPFVNLLAPVFGAAAAAHLYHRRSL